MRWLRENIFLVDGLGAVASGLGTGGLLPLVHSWIGLSPTLLYGLAVPAAGFAVYSLLCWARGARLVPWLGLVMGGNLLYCAVVAGIIANHETVTTLGVAYFAWEIVVVVGVVALEGWIIRTDQRAPGAVSRRAG